MFKKFFCFIIICFTFVIAFSKVNAAMLGINEVNEKFQTSFINVFNEAGSNLSSVIDSNNNTLNIYDGSSKIATFRYTNEYIEYNDRDTAITQESVEENFSNALYLSGIFRSILDLSGYADKVLNYNDDNIMDYSNIYDTHGLQIETEQLPNGYTISDGTVIDGYYIRYYKVALNTEKISRLMEDYGVSECPIYDGESYYNIKFEVNGGESLDNSRVCSTCSDAFSYEFPIPKREGYEFEGWYLDDKLSKKIESLVDIYFEIMRDLSVCDTGEMKVTLYAKWKKVENVSVPNTGVYLRVFSVIFSLLFLVIGIGMIAYIKRKKIN